MLNPERVPYAAARAAYSAWARDGGNNIISAMEHAIAAAINAWPGSYSLTENDSAEIRDVAAIILPLTENTNAEG